MQLTLKLGRPELCQHVSTNNGPLQDMSASDRGYTARLWQRSDPAETCRTAIVTRVLHQGEEVPKDQSLQWLISEILARNALHQGDEPSRGINTDETTVGQSSSSTLTLHLECGGNGQQGQDFQASGSAHARDYTPRSPSSQPLSALARHYANIYFDAYWGRTPDGAPCRYTDAHCWHPGVQAAVISTVTQLRQQGAHVNAAPILAFMQDKAVRQHGEVKNGHRFKRPPSKKCMARYRAIAAAWSKPYSQHQLEGTLPTDVQAILCRGEALQGSPWKADVGMCQLSRSQWSAPSITAPDALAVLVNPFLTSQSQAFAEPCTFPAKHESLPSPEASDELDESWLASMVAELLEPGGHQPSSTSGSQSAVLPELDFMSKCESLSENKSLLPQQPCQSNKRKRCFSAAE